MNKNIFTKEDEKGIVVHMNDDHSSSLIHYCHLFLVASQSNNLEPGTLR